jgi:hypothetical protein
MTHMNFVNGFAALLLAIVPASAIAQDGRPARVGMAQQSATSADIQRLQTDVSDVASEIARLRSTNADLASRLQTELDELREEAIYLKVKLRKEGTVTRGEYLDLRDRIDDVRVRARADDPVRQGAWKGNPPNRPPATIAGPPPRESSSSAIPVGHELDVRLQTELSSETAQVEDRFEATTVADLYRGNDVLIPAGSVLRGVVRTVDKATRTDRRGELTVSFDQVTVRGRTYPMRATVIDTIKSEGIKGEVGRIGAGSAIGGVIGGIIGGVKGAVLGVLIGGGGTMAATPGKDVTLPPGTILRVRLDTPPDIR